MFKKTKIINKSGDHLEDVYLSYWTDDDLGNAGDDFVGCDTSLSLGFTYNCYNNDENHYETPPPAVGHLMVQGPIVPASSTDSARYDDGWRKGFKNLPMTAFHFYIGASSTYSDPDLGVYPGTTQLYYQMQGKIWNGDPVIDPGNGMPTTFSLSGDPVTQQGWYEGDGWPGGPWPGDRRYLMSSGPFNMAPGDTQEVVYAIYMAQGTDNINSVTKLKEKAHDLINFYNYELIDINNRNQNLFPNEFILFQNYPNPFNIDTKIKFILPVIDPSESEVNTKLEIYDILGRKVKTMIDNRVTPGSYEVEFKGTGLASGVYIYRLTAGGKYSSIKKMLLLK